MDETPTPQSVPEGTKGEKKDYTKVIIGAVVVLAVLYGVKILFSPERVMERAIEEAYEDAGVDVDVDQGGDTNVTFSSEDGESYTVTTGEDVAVPNTWPKSVPIPGDAKVTYAGTMMAGQPGGGTTLAFSTSQSVAEITAYYKRELESNGWTIAVTVATGEGSMLSATRSEDESVVLYIGTSSEGTTVNMTVQATE